MKQFIGIDPGGRNAMGWCVLTTDEANEERWQSGVCDGANECLDAISQHLQGSPISAGIDAPLY